MGYGIKTTLFTQHPHVLRWQCEEPPISRLYKNL